MKKSALFLGALLACAHAATAQTQPAAQDVHTAPIGVQRVRMGVNDIHPEQEADQKASLLAGQLSLSPEQTARVRAAALVESQERLASLKKENARATHEGMKEEGEAITNKFEKELKATLTPAQYERRLMIQARFRRIREQADAAEKAGAQPAVSPK